MDPANEFEKHVDGIPTKDQVAAGERIKRLRSFRGLTCAELAKRIGCTRPYLSAVENGRYPVSTKILRKLSGALNVTHDFFMNAQEPDLEDTEALTRDMLNRKMAERARETVGAARRASASRMIPVVSVTAAGRPLAAFDDFPTGGGYDAMVLDSPPVMPEGVYSGVVRAPLYGVIQPVVSTSPKGSSMQYAYELRCRITE